MGLCPIVINLESLKSLKSLVFSQTEAKKLFQFGISFKSPRQEIKPLAPAVYGAI